MVDAASAKANTVVHVMQKGYQIAERVLRPAMVVVARADPPRATGQLKKSSAKPLEKTGKRTYLAKQDATDDMPPSATKRLNPYPAPSSHPVKDTRKD